MLEPFPRGRRRTLLEDDMETEFIPRFTAVPAPVAAPTRQAAEGRGLAVVAFVLAAVSIVASCVTAMAAVTVVLVALIG